MDIKNIIKSITDQIQKHKDVIHELEGELRVLNKYLRPNGTLGFVGVDSEKPEEGNIKKNESSGKKYTFKSAILEFLSDDTPKKARDLYERYKDLKGTPNYSYKSFSPQLSGLSEVKTIELKERPNDDRFYYGLVEWFDGNEMREEYKDKIPPISSGDQEDMFAGYK